MNDKTKSWAFLVLAFVAGFGASRALPNLGDRSKQRSEWANHMKTQSRPGWERGAKKGEFKGNQEQKGRRRGKGEGGPSK